MTDDRDKLPSDAEDTDLTPRSDKAETPTSQPADAKDEEGPSEQPS